MGLLTYFLTKALIIQRHNTCNVKLLLNQPKCNTAKKERKDTTTRAPIHHQSSAPEWGRTKQQMIIDLNYILIYLTKEERKKIELKLQNLKSFESIQATKKVTHHKRKM